jgi:predicted short-subunit dehydrogenase-like oxidoreductase (DUF2520 family)
MRIGFIGAGNVGFTLAKYINDKYHNVCGIYSKNIDDAKDCAKFSISEYYSSLKEIVDSCDTLFLTVNDDQIKYVVKELIDIRCNNKILIHTSGSISSEVFMELLDNNSCYSLHPIYAFNDKYNSYKDFSNAYLTLEGNNLDKVDEIKNLFDRKVVLIDSCNKSRYHAGCVMISNLVCSLVDIGYDLFKSIGINDLSIFNPLIKNNIDNILNVGAKDALTGPIRRCDIETVKKHLDVLTDEEKEIYIRLSLKLVDISKELNNSDYSKIYDLLKGELK